MGNFCLILLLYMFIYAVLGNIAISTLFDAMLNAV